MKAYLTRNKGLIFFIIICMGIWRLLLYAAQLVGSVVIPQHPGYIGPIPWANMDGIHYLAIASRGYSQYEQAFFPFFPYLIHLVSLITHNELLAGMIIVHVSLFISMFLLYSLVKIDFSKMVAYESIVFFLFFPTSFFLGAIYTESLFIMLLLGFFLAIRKQQWFLAGIIGLLASSTRIVGVVLIIAFLIELIAQSKDKHAFIFMLKKHLVSMMLIPVGLFSYMYYLFITVKDPLFFIHAQAAFGANRSSGQIILLPQVLFRYIKILMTIPLTNHDFWIALLEVGFFLGAVIMLVYKWRSIRMSYNAFAILALSIPTLSGTLSSMPRYILVAFPLYMVLSNLSNVRVKIVCIVLFICLLFILTSFFTQGYFIG